MKEVELDDRPESIDRARRLVALLEWAGCCLALLGSAMLALKNDASPYCFIPFLCSNACLVTAAVRRTAPALLLMQLGFTTFNLVGAKNWLLS